MGIFDGIKVIELARVPPAEMPGMFLADYGADVLKIETPEPRRTHDAQEERRAAFAFVNRNKRSMTLNMKAPAGQDVFRKLAAEADVIIEGFRPGVMKRLGAGYEDLKTLNPRLIYCSLSGFGQDGPYRDYPAHDMNYLSLAGVLNLIGKPDQFVRAANAEEERARQEIEAVIKTRDRDEWYDILVKADVCVGKVYDIEEMVKDPQINHRQMIVEADHPKFGKVKQFGIAIKLSDTPGSVRRAAPTAGEQTEDVLKSLGMTAEAIGDLRKTGVIE